MALDTTDLRYRFTAKAGTTIVSDGLDAWTEQVSGSDQVTAPTASERPSMVTNQINGVDCPHFDGSDDVLSIANFTDQISYGLESVLTYAAVLRVPPGQSFGYIWDGGDSINYNALYANEDDIVVRTGSESVTFAGYADDSVFRIIIKFVNDQAAGYDGAEVYINGTLVSGSNILDMKPMGGLTFGQRQDGFGHGEFTLAEHLIYSADKDASTLDQYLQDEWVTSSEATHTLLVESGTYTYSGQTVETTVNYDLPITNGTYSYTEQTLNLTKEYILTVENGTYSFTENNIDFSGDIPSIFKLRIGFEYGDDYFYPPSNMFR